MSTEQLRVGAIRRLILLIDHDNQSIDTRQIVRNAISHFQVDGNILYVRIRAYGGWFEGGFTSDARYNAASHYQESCPVVMEVGSVLVRLSFEFADGLLLSTKLGSKIQITHTVGIRGTAGEIAPKSSGPQCKEPDCKLTELRRWARKRTACLASTCPFKFVDFFQRREQKQVDVHIACDLIYAAGQPDSQEAVCIVSDDLDLMPAILHAALLNPTRPMLLVRSNHNVTYQDSILRQLSVLQLSI